VTAGESASPALEPDSLPGGSPSVFVRYRTPVLSWACVAVAILWVQQVAFEITYRGARGLGALVPSEWHAYAGRIGWDSGVYLRIAEYGYRPEDGLEAGFPAYGLAIRALHAVGLDIQTAAVLLSLAFGLAATLLFWRWMEGRGIDPRTRRLALWLFLVYPYAFMMFGVAYSDPMLLAAVLAVAVCADDRRWWLAGLLGGVATATRPTGLVVLVYLAVAVFDDAGGLVVPERVAASTVAERLRAGWSTVRGVRLRRPALRPAHAWVLLALWGIGAYMVFLWRYSGDPFRFWTVQDSDYGHGSILDFRTWIHASFLVEPGLEIHHVGDVVNELAATVVFVATVVCAPWIGRRFGWAYTALMWGFALMIWFFDRWLAPAGRYLLPVVPFLAVWLATLLVDRPWGRRLTLAGFAAGSLTLAAGFAGAFEIHW